MDQATHNKLVSFIWGIADDVLRDLFKRGKYPDVILPMCVIRRMDAVLEPTKKKVLDMKKMLDEARITGQRAALCDAAGQAFYNTSKFTLRDLKSRGSQQQLLADFEDYLNGFSPNVQDILDNFKFRNQLQTLSKSYRKIAVVQRGLTDAEVMAKTSAAPERGNRAVPESAKFHFESPDGKRYNVEGPAGSTVEQAFGILQRKLQSESSGGRPWEKYQTHPEAASGRPWLYYGPDKLETMNVKLPDGTTVTRVPAGTTQGELAARLRASGRAVPDEWMRTPPKEPTKSMQSSEEHQPASGKDATFDLSTARPVLAADDVVEIKAPNGARIPFPKTLPSQEMKSVAAEYADLLSSRANHERLMLIARVFAIWLSSCLSVYVLGWSGGWVYRGFRKPS